MSHPHIKCPGCRKSLEMPANLASRRVRCAFCKTVFDVARPRRTLSQEDVIAQWLGRTGKDDVPAREGSDAAEKTYLAAAANEPDPPTPAVQSAGAAEGPHSREPAVATATRLIRVVRLLPQSVEFEFPAERLVDPQFRLAIPRRCMRCNGRVGLGCFLVIFAPHILSDVDLAHEHQAGHISLSAQELGQLRGDELLRRLPAVPSVPYPGNLPFPYFVCQQCNSVGLAAGQIQVNTETHKGQCRLMLASLSVAMEFFATVGDADSDDYQRLSEALAKLQADPWSALPVNVRHRVDQWFKQFSGEAFLAFVPDADVAGNEVGMAGLLISTRRVVYHRPPRHRETTVEDTFLIHVLGSDDKQHLRLESSRLSAVTMSTDRAGLQALREGFHMAGVTTKWA